MANLIFPVGLCKGDGGREGAFEGAVEVMRVHGRGWGGGRGAPGGVIEGYHDALMLADCHADGRSYRAVSGRRGCEVDLRQREGGLRWRYLIYLSLSCLCPAQSVGKRPCTNNEYILIFLSISVILVFP